MGCSASKPGLVNEFRDVKLDQIQNAKLTPPSIGHVVAQSRPREEPQKPNAAAQPGFFDANLTFANVVWNNATKASQQESQPASKPALRAAGTSAAPTLAAPKKAPAKPPSVPTYKPPPPAAAAWPVGNDNWGEEDWDEDYDDEDDDDARMADPDMFRTRVNHANFEWEGNGEHIDVLPKKDDKSMPNPFVGVPLPLGGQPVAKPPQVSMYKPSPLEKAAEAMAKEGKANKGPSMLTVASPFAAKPAAAKAAAPTSAMASPFASGAKPLHPAASNQQVAASAAMQSIMMNGTPEQQAALRNMMKNHQGHAVAQAAFATAQGGGGMYPSVQHGQPQAGGMYPSVQHGQSHQVPNGYTNEMLMQQMQAQRLQQQMQMQKQQQGWA